MSTDSSVAVRLEAVQQINLFKEHYPQLSDRLRDVKSEIRIAMLTRFTAHTSIKAFKQPLRERVVKLCLTDRDEHVHVVGVKLVISWLDPLLNSGIPHRDVVPKLLQLMNPLEFEDTALLLGATLVEELLRADVQQTYSDALKDSVKESRPDLFEAGLNGITPAEILWVYIRCNHAKSFCPVLQATEICERLMPSAEAVGTLLGEASNADDLASSEKNQFAVKYLLKIAALIGGGDKDAAVSAVTKGNRQLLARECETLLSSVNLRDDLMEAALRTLCVLQVQQGYAGSAGSSRQSSVDTIMNLVTDMQNRAIDAGSEGVRHLLRALQISYWVLEQEVGSASHTSASAADGASSASKFDSLVPFVLSAVQQPDARLRNGAISCLGLLCLMQPALFREHKGIIYQAARVTDETCSVRIAAITCLADLACVHKDLFEDDSGLCTILLRVQESDDPDLVPIAAESAAKLLFAGVISDPSLFANLLRFFFFSELLAANEDGEAANDMDTASSRLQQILSIFFQAFMVSEGRCEQVAMESVPQLVADMTNSVKFSGAKITSLHTVLKHLLTLCDNMQPVHRSSIDANPANSLAADMKDLIKQRAVAAICRELLKLANSKIDKLLVKEYVKVLGSLNVEEWVCNENKNTIRSVFQAVVDSVVLDKASQKVMSNLITVCSVPGGEEAHEEGYFDAFLLSAPGLADLVAIASRTDGLGGNTPERPEDSDEENTAPAVKKTKRSTSKESQAVAPSRSSTSTAASGKSRAAKKVTKKAESSDDEEEDEESENESEEEDGSDAESVEVTVPVETTTSSRGGLGRSSKAAASQKIAKQLKE
eukprot:gene25350-31796_t